MSSYAELIDQFQKSVLQAENESGDALASAKPKFSGTQQLQAYIDAYHIRLQKVLAKDYPALIHYLGEKTFNQLALSYIRMNPSHSWNLNHYTPPFAAHICAQQQDAFASALAELESTLNKAYHAQDSEALTMKWLQGQTEDYVMTHVLSHRTALHLLSLTHDAHSYLSAFREHADTATKPKEETCYLAINRHKNTVRRVPLDASEYHLLKAFQDGKTLPEALETPEVQQEQEHIATHLQTWLAKWMENGFFRLP